MEERNPLPTYRVYGMPHSPWATKSTEDDVTSLIDLMHQREDQGKPALEVLRKYLEGLPDQGFTEQAPPLPSATPVVYYMLFSDRVKIGTTTNLKLRRVAIPHDELLATEPGGYDVERRRHDQFAALHVKGEWYRYAGALKAHIAALPK